MKKAVKKNPTKVRTSEKSQIDDKKIEKKFRKTKGLKKLQSQIKTK